MKFTLAVVAMLFTSVAQAQSRLSVGDIRYDYEKQRIVEVSSMHKMPGFSDTLAVYGHDQTMYTNDDMHRFPLLTATTDEGRFVVSDLPAHSRNEPSLRELMLITREIKSSDGQVMGYEVQGENGKVYMTPADLAKDHSRIVPMTDIEETIQSTSKGRNVRVSMQSLYKLALSDRPEAHGNLSRLLSSLYEGAYHPDMLKRMQNVERVAETNHRFSNAEMARNFREMSVRSSVSASGIAREAVRASESVR